MNEKLERIRELSESKLLENIGNGELDSIYYYLTNQEQNDDIIDIIINKLEEGIDNNELGAISIFNEFF